jgi:hypothetical protein
MDNRATTDRTPLPNSTFEMGWVSCSADSLVVAESFVLRIKFSGKNPAHTKPQNDINSKPNPYEATDNKINFAYYHHLNVSGNKVVVCLAN